ncbi:MAG TPA: YbbC/YhhH family protein [Acidobacteriota bacterium]|nr:YbbC/YhhH family protein [Acidobacteriota bacterium]
MRKRFLLPMVLVSVFAFGYSQAQSDSSVQPKSGFVPNAETAVKIAEAVLVPVYGEKKILAERPFNAKLGGDVWTVIGSLHCGAPHCVGGTAEVKISKSSGQILQMVHYK